VRQGQFLAVRGHLRMLGGQFLANGQGLAIGRLRLLRAACVRQQHAQVGVRDGQVLTVLGHLRMLGDELLVKGQGLAIGRLRLLRATSLQ
jgi:hypothetical protein